MEEEKFILDEINRNGDFWDYKFSSLENYGYKVTVQFKRKQPYKIGEEYFLEKMTKKLN